VGLFYDPMLAKLIVHGWSREEAVARMRRALLELTIEGVDTSREFHLRVMEDDEFRRGDITIQWLEQRLPSLLRGDSGPEGRRVAAIAAALAAERDRATRRVAGRGGAAAEATPAGRDAWRDAARREGVGRS
jgi:acetyl-CoA carboxylase biotin carboxylase subunit